MKKVNRTKNFSVTQATNMAENLREKFKRYCMISHMAQAFSSNPLEHQYRIYVEDHTDENYEDWEVLQYKYFSLMDGE